MASIRVLDPHVADKIAAGEVVERPVSVVKELLENAIDAGATEIAISVKDGGLAEIKIVDNGSGMSEEDLPLAFERHATSKINAFEDLFRLHGFGFRGEALASIASISQVEAVSGTGTDAPAHRLLLMPGRPVQLQKEAPFKGTAITIRNLFFNVPARRKFMKSVTQEFAQISHVVTQYALAYPSINFILNHGGRQVYTTTGRTDVIARLLYTFGPELDAHILHLESTELLPGHFAEAWIGDSTITYNNRQHEFFFVNGRLVKSKELSQLVEDAAYTYIPKGRFPLVLMRLTVPADTIDVNIHPAKTTVKLETMDRWAPLLQEALQDLIWRSKVAVEWALQSAPMGAPTVTDKPEMPSTQTIETGSAVAEKARFEPLELPGPTQQTEQNQVSEKELFRAETRVSEGKTEYALQDPQDTESTEGEERQGFIPARFSENQTKPLQVNELEHITILGQLNNTFILAQNENGLYIIDQHTCHERILYERYMYAESQKEVHMQRFLIPQTFTVTLAQEQLLVDHVLNLRALGIMVEKSGDRTYDLIGLPAVILNEIHDYRAFFMDLMENLLEHPTLDMAHIREEIVITASCKGAVKAHWPLSLAEMHRLLEELAQLNNPHTCPHGRPIIMSITMKELYKKFQRGHFAESD